MIKFEHNSLVLDASHSNEDQQAINDFIDYKVGEAFDVGWEAGYDAALIDFQDDKDISYEKGYSDGYQAALETLNK